MVLKNFIYKTEIEKVMVEEEYSEEDTIQVEDKTKEGNVPKTEEEIKEDMESNKDDEEVYEEQGREKLVEDDEIDTWEEGFMEGADSAGQLGKDALTGEPLSDVEDVVETEINGKKYRFVSKENAEKYREKHQKQ